jgi:photosystem II stability/assembly factor-like uncharacterized protein
MFTRYVRLISLFFLLACVFVGCDCEDADSIDDQDAASVGDSGIADVDVAQDAAADTSDTTGDAVSDTTNDASDAGDTSDTTDADAGSVDPTTSEVPIAGGTFHIVRNGLFGGTVHALERSTSSPDVVYAGTSGAGIFRSDDGGRSWRPTSLDAGTVREIAIHPTDADKIWAINRATRTHPSPNTLSERKLITSADGGQTFSTITLPEDAYPQQIAASDGALWLTGNELFRSTDDGATWTTIDAPVSTSTVGLVAHPSNPDTAWIEHTIGVWRTEDAGASFVELTPSLETSAFVSGLSASPLASAQQASPRLWLAISNGKPYRSDDGGTTWTRLVNTPGRSHTIAAASDDADTVWMSTNQGAQARSDDAGATWESVTEPRSTFRSNIPGFSARNADEALAFGGPEEVMLTEDAGGTWRRSVEGLSAVWVRDVAVSPDGSRLVVATDHGDVFVSDDQGRSFSRTRAGLDPLAITAIAIDPANSDVVYVGTGTAHGSTLHRTNFAGALFKSGDGGQSFSRLTNLRPNDTYVNDIDDVRVAYNADVLVTSGTSTYRSTDGGLSWQDLQASPRAFITDVRKTPGGSETALTGRTYSGSVSSTPAVSSDLGATWTTVEQGGDALAIDRTELVASSRVAPQVHYASTRSAFGKYTGSTWGRAEVGLATTPGTHPELSALGVGRSITDTDLVLTAGYSSTSQWSVHASDDGASSWTSTVILFVGVPTSIAVADEAGEFGVIGLEAGRGLLVTRTGGF